MHINKLFIVGNGFDLAHNLKTRYSDFILWYINKVSEKYNKSNGEIEDTLVSIKRTEFTQWIQIPEKIDIWSFVHNYKSYGVELNYMFNFVKNLFEETSNKNWVDIETYYFGRLKKIFQRRESINHNFSSDLIALNNALYTLKSELKSYLLEIKEFTMIEEMSEIFKMEFSECTQNRKIIHLLNFNYTDTLEKYLSVMPGAFINYIHGRASTGEELIFGYGDEMDKEYIEMEGYNSNELLKNFKSFSYALNNKYRKIHNFAESEPYEIIVIGHSCGMSDRVLLNFLFENPNCKNIKIYYHDKGNGKNDFYEKVQEISRHFKPENNHKMRSLIHPFDESMALPQKRAILT